MVTHRSATGKQVLVISCKSILRNRNVKMDSCAKVSTVKTATAEWAHATVLILLLPDCFYRRVSGSCTRERCSRVCY